MPEISIFVVVEARRGQIVVENVRRNASLCFVFLSKFTKLNFLSINK